MNILFLPNWSVHFLNEDNNSLQAPDKNVCGKPYWFFNFFKSEVNVSIIDIHSNSFISKFEKKVKFYLYQAFLAYMNQRKYDIIISHGAQSGVLLSLLRYLFGKGKTKHVIFDIGGMNGGKSNGLSTRLIQVAMKSKPYIIAHSTVILDNIKNVYPMLNDRVKYIPFGIGLYQYKFIQCPLSHDIFVFSGLNRDTDTVYEAWKNMEFDDLSNDMVINFVGVKDINEYNGKNLRCIHKLPYNCYTDLLQHSQFVILPLPIKRHSYGQMSLLGSLALGKNVIASNVPGIEDYIHNCDYITSVNPYDVKDMKSAMIKLCKKNINTNLVGAREYVAKNFTEEQMGIQIDEFINGIL